MVSDSKKQKMMTIEEHLQNDRFSDPQKIHENDQIWWIGDLDYVGFRFFSFDLKTIFEFWSDYPDKLTPEQIEIFKKECPDLAELRR